MKKNMILISATGALILGACSATTGGATNQAPRSSMTKPANSGQPTNNASTVAQVDVASLLRKGMTKQQVRDALGEPNSKSQGLGDSFWAYDAVTQWSWANFMLSS